jgi:hypothetical protein
VATLLFRRRLAERDITVTHSRCMDLLRWWYKKSAHVVSSSTALALVTKLVRNGNLCHLLKSKWKIGKKQSLLKRDVVSQLEKGEWIVDMP